MRSRRLLIAGLCALVFSAGSPAASLSTTADPDRTAAQRAVFWVLTQQQPDGGFELAKFPGFETPEAVLAIAANAQPTSNWSGRVALSAVQHVVTAAGLTPLDYLDRFASAKGDDAITGGIAARLITLVTAPLCLDARAFDPSGDGPTDLLAIVDSAARESGAYGSDGVLSDTLYAALAFASVARTVPDATVRFIRDAQEADGGWNYLGSPDDQGYDDIDTTALAVQALLAAGVPATDPAIDRALSLLRTTQNEDGSWSFFGSPDPNATSVAWLAFDAAGVTPSYAAKPFLRSQQGEDGRVQSPNDSFGVNTVATTQATRALLGTALPVPVVAGTCNGDGYSLIGADGGVLTFGSGFHGSAAATPLNAPIVDAAVAASGRGYYLFARDGGVFAFGDASYLGSDVGHDSAIVGGDVDDGGYRLFSASGVVRFHRKGDFDRFIPGPPRINAPIVGGAATSFDGSLLFASDGGVFSSGDAPFYGSMGGTPLNAPIVGGAVTPTRRGYVLFAADGGVFSFGDAPYLGSLGNLRLNAPIVGGDMSATGNGYVLFAADGGVFAFGDVDFAGSAASTRLNAPVVGGAID